MNTPALPKGWRLETFHGLAMEGQPAPQFTRAIDPDGCKWYGSTGRWRLNVPWFRRSRNLPRHRSDDIAIVETTDGNREYPITEKGTIRIGKRRIGPRRWDH